MSYLRFQDDDDSSVVVVQEESEETPGRFRLCDDCYRYLIKPSVSGPSVDAIANYHFFGELPAELLASVPASGEGLFSFCTLLARIEYHSYARTGGSRALRGTTSLLEGLDGGVFHNALQELDAREFARCFAFVTRDVSDEDLQRLSAARRVDVGALKAILAFLKENNFLFAAVDRTDEELESAATSFGRIERVDFTTAAATTSVTGESAVTSSMHVLRAETDGAINQIVEMQLSSSENPVTGRTAAIVVSPGSSFVAADAAWAMPKAFPFHFPSGFGFVESRRGRPTSTATELSRYLRLPHLQGLDMDLFLATHFSHMTWSQVQTSVSFKMHVPSKTDVDRVLRVTADDMRRAAQELRTKRAAPQGDASGAASSSPAEKLLNLSSTARSDVSGTMEQRLMWRRRLFAQNFRFGLPSWFVTLNLADRFSRDMLGRVVGPRSACLYSPGGEVVVPLSDLLPDAEHMAAPENVAATIARSPVGQARYFDFMMRLVIKHLFGADRVGAGAGKGAPGVFGRLKAYFLAPETNGRGCLHGHALLWVEGMPRTAEEFSAARASNPAQFDSALFAHHESIVHSDYGITPATAVCPHCRRVAAFETFVSPGARFRLRSTNLSEPIAGTCVHCHAEATSAAIIAATVLTQLRPADSAEPIVVDPGGGVEVGDISPASLEKLVREHVWRGDSVWRDDASGELDTVATKAVVNALAAAFQTHLWGHTTSCVKHGDACRYRKPNGVVDDSVVTPEGEVQFRCPALCAWLNSTAVVFLEVFGANSDASTAR